MRWEDDHEWGEDKGLEEVGLRKTTKALLWSRVLPEKLIIAQLEKKVTAFYGNRTFNTVFIKAR
jgi:hypothetical protein